jgi:hypothetical protein
LSVGHSSPTSSKDGSGLANSIDIGGSTPTESSKQDAPQQPALGTRTE